VSPLSALPTPSRNQMHNQASTVPANAGSAGASAAQTAAAEKAQSAGSSGEALPGNYVKEHTLFIFDWDDTILPTTWLSTNDLRVDKDDDVPPALKQQLDEYAPWAMRTLKEAMKYGSVLIVTNAETGWIELNIDKFFPSWKEIVDQIPCQSARSTWEPTGCTMPVEWKVRSFTTEIEAFYHAKGARVRKNIIGLGDSTSDREAILHVTGNMNNALGKSLKFMERPNLEHLQKQHHLIASSIKQIAFHEKSLDLCIQHQMSNTTPPAGAAAAAAPSAAGGDASDKTTQSTAATANSAGGNGVGAAEDANGDTAMTD